MIIPQYHMLVDLDALVDTRLALLFDMDEQLAKRVMTNWPLRIEDNWPEIKGKVFIERYQQRTKSLLQLALPTLVGPWVLQELYDASVSNIGKPSEGEAALAVNIYPYQFSPKEQKLLLAGLTRKFGGLAPVRLVDLSTAELRPSRLKEFTVWVKYDFWDWFDVHETLGSFKAGEMCPDVTLISPKVETNGGKKKGSIAIDPWEALVELTAPIINLHLQPVALFSAPISTA